jgi:hypothetical protein
VELRKPLHGTIIVASARSNRCKLRASVQLHLYPSSSRNFPKMSREEQLFKKTANRLHHVSLFSSPPRLKFDFQTGYMRPKIDSITMHEPSSSFNGKVPSTCRAFGKQMYLLSIVSIYLLSLSVHLQITFQNVYEQPKSSANTSNVFFPFFLQNSFESSRCLSENLQHKMDIGLPLFFFFFSFT